MCLFGPGCDPGRTAGGSAEDSKVHFRRNSQIFLRHARTDRKSTRLNSSHTVISYAVFCLKKKCTKRRTTPICKRHTHPPYPGTRKDTYTRETRYVQTYSSATPTPFTSATVFHSHTHVNLR